MFLHSVQIVAASGDVYNNESLPWAFEFRQSARNRFLVNRDDFRRLCFLTLDPRRTPQCLRSNVEMSETLDVEPLRSFHFSAIVTILVLYRPIVRRIATSTKSAENSHVLASALSDWSLPD